MKGQQAVAKDKFEIAIENQINAYIDSLDLNQNNQLLPPEVQRAKIMEELKEATSYTELSTYLIESLNLLRSQGQEYLDKEKFEELENVLSEIPKIIDQVDLNKELTESYQEILKFNDSVMESILKIAIAKFDEEKYADMIALCTLLTTLSPNNYDYWFKLGIAAQKAQNYNLALRAYEAANDIHPDLIGAKLFSVECHIMEGHPEIAKKALEDATKIAETTEVEEGWRKLLTEVKTIVDSINTSSK
jgi:tetratricopeptide (TPR) repeat protein